MINVFILDLFDSIIWEFSRTALERLAKLNITTLEERRIRGDLITLFKLKKNLDNINWHNPSRIFASWAKKRGQLRREFLNNRVAAHWNKLPDQIIESKTTNQLKNKLDQYYREKKQ